MRNQYILPVTIIVAGLFIAGAVFFAGKNVTPAGNTNTPQPNKAPAVTAADHMLGSPNAPVKVVVYSDLECPYCKQFETTMHQVINYYGPSGKVAWVYRHFPLTQIHSKAPKEAEAAECAAEQGGNQGFFNFVDKVYAVSPLENGLDLAQLPVIAGQVGLNVETFKQCLSSNKYAARVQQQYNDAIKAGGQGTPYILVTYGGDVVTLSGAQPYDSMRAVIDTILGGLPAGSTASTTTQ